MRLIAVITALSVLACAAQARRPTHPDLSGTWTHASYTWLQRPAALKSLVITPAEAEAYEAPRRALNGELNDPHDELGQAASEFPEGGPGLARIDGEIRSSWIVDPADGRIPWTPAARERSLRFLDRSAAADYAGVETRETDERCLTANGGGAPLLNTHDGNLLVIVQTPDTVAIVSEKNHDARIIHIAPPGGPTEPADSELPTWFGHSIGHWEGSTLVVITTRLRPGLTKQMDDLMFSDRTRVVERFTRSGPRKIRYQFEVTDPTLFTQTWRGDMVIRASDTPMFEYACHEGNYSLPGILAGARQADEQQAR